MLSATIFEPLAIQIPDHIRVPQTHPRDEGALIGRDGHHLRFSHRRAAPKAHSARGARSVPYPAPFPVNAVSDELFPKYSSTRTTIQRPTGPSSPKSRLISIPSQFARVVRSSLPRTHFFDPYLWSSGAVIFCLITTMMMLFSYRSVSLYLCTSPPSVVLVKLTRSTVAMRPQRYTINEFFDASTLADRELGMK